MQWGSEPLWSEGVWGEVYPVGGVGLHTAVIGHPWSHLTRACISFVLADRCGQDWPFLLDTDKSRRCWRVFGGGGGGGEGLDFLPVQVASWDSEQCVLDSVSTTPVVCLFPGRLNFFEQLS